MFLRLKVINGRPYLHAEKRWHENGVQKSRDWVLTSVFSGSHAHQQELAKKAEQTEQKRLS